MKPLSIEHFDSFLQEVHGHLPFPWQSRLLAQVVETGWPEVLDLPTATGKTTALDVAVFHQALEAHLPPGERRAPRRIAYVVDRRVVVDQAHLHARRVADALRVNGSPVVSVVAERLASLTGPAPAPAPEHDERRVGGPLATAILRGGMVRDDGWVRSGDQPTILVSTVDQVGSRILFRGYGVSDGMRPVHAGLLGSDTLFLLDEVHLSQPFADTLAWLGGGPIDGLESWKGYRTWRKVELPDRWSVVALSATPRKATPGFSLTDEDRTHDELGKRLAARKLATLEKVKISKEAQDPLQAFGRAAAARALKLVEGENAVVGLLLNRVDSARAAAEALRAEAGDAAEVVLVTGRMRPLDRDDLLDRRDEVSGPSLLERLVDRTKRGPGDHPLIVVSTQAIEAGADFDLDALVTECASLDALRQRFGRVDRRGDRGETRSVIIRRTGEAGKDPIYGEALDQTWKLLESLGAKKGIDFGSEALTRTLDGISLDGCLSPRVEAPLVRPADLDAWARTRPAPSADPEPSLFLHGAVDARPEVQVVWRHEVAPLEDANTKDLDEALVSMLEALSACPPSSLEALSLPLGAVRGWLSQAHPPQVADVEGIETEEGAVRSAGKLAIRWRGEDSEFVLGREVRPGDTLLVPPSYGGIRNGNWDPTAPASREEPISDWGDRAQWLHRGRATLRLDKAALAVWEPVAAPPVPGGDPVADTEALDAWLAQVSDSDEVPEWIRDVARELAQSRNRKVIQLHRPDGARVLQARRTVPHPRATGASDLVSDEALTSFVSSAVPLDVHLEAVGAEARRLSASLGLPQQIADDVGLAARLHDVGKADPRFQRMLYGGSEAAFRIGGTYLAKSGLSAGDRRAREEAGRTAGWPRRLRHELTSVALVLESPLLETAHDPDLVLHLIAAHHGHARPLVPAVADPDPVMVRWRFGGHDVAGTTDHGLWRLDADLPARYEQLTARYGWYGLAWLEAIVRLADQRVSALQAGEPA